MWRVIVTMDGKCQTSVPIRFIVLLVVLHLLFLGVVLSVRHVWNMNLMYDLLVYEKYIGYHQAGLIPFIDVRIDDYPPVFTTYLWLFQWTARPVPLSIVMGVINLACIIVSLILVRRMTGFNYWYYLLSLSSYVFFAVRFEPLVLFLSVLSIYLYRGNRYMRSAFVAALAISLKWFFGFFVIAVLMRERMKGIEYAFFVGVFYLLLNSPFIALAPDNFLHPFQWHGQRVPVNDGIYNVFLVAGYELPYQTIFPVAMIIGMIFIYRRPLSLIKTYLLLILLFLMTSKVYSPQFNLWIVLFLLVYQNLRIYVLTWEFLNILIFPFMYIYVFDPIAEPWYLLMVLARHVTLLILFLIIYNNRSKNEQNNIYPDFD